MSETIEQKCIKKGVKLTEQRRVIAKVMTESADHPDVEELHHRAAEIDSSVSIATVYRTVRLFEEAGILDRHDFGDGRARYEESTYEHHDHLINIKTGAVIEFTNEEIEAIQDRIAREHGLRLVDHRHELYGIPIEET